MVVKAKIRKIGNSKGIILNSTILKHLDLKIGDELDITFDANYVTLKKSTTRGKK